MELTKKDILTIQSIVEELRLYRNSDEETREMAEEGLYSDEIELVEKLGIQLNN